MNMATMPETGRRAGIVKVLKLLHKRRAPKYTPTIVETGTTRGTLGGGARLDGWATLAWGWYAKTHGACVYTIDLLEEALRQCREITKEYEGFIEYVQGNAAAAIEALDVKVIDLLYLDSSDDPQDAMAELKAAYIRLRRDSIVMVDDTRLNPMWGKGTVVHPWLLDHGWRVVFESPGKVDNQVIYVRS